MESLCDSSAPGEPGSYGRLSHGGELPMLMRDAANLNC